MQFRSLPDRALEIEQIVEEHYFATTDARDTFTQEQTVAAEAAAFGDNQPFCSALRDLDFGGDGVGLLCATTPKRG